MIRIFKLVVLLVISQVAFGQAPSNYTNINGRYRWIAGMFDSTLHIPKGSTPSLRTGGSTNSGGLFYNTSDSSVYTYTGTQWIKLRGSINPSDTTNKYVTQVYKKSGSDSIFYVKGGTHTWAFNDSTGSPGGGGGGKVYYFNGGVSMGTFGGFQMYELGDTANTGAAANFTRSTTGNIANFITDPGKPGLLQIPAGVWSVDAWLSETGGGANHAEIWIEVEKWDGSTITTIATSPIEQITEGATPNLYSWSVSIPTTSLTVTDRIIIQFYISNTNGKTVTLYTQNGYVGEVHTTFTTGIGAINGLTAPAQYLVTGTSGVDFNISSATATHTFNLPTASSMIRGALSPTDWSAFNNKIGPSDTASMLSPYFRLAGVGLKNTGQTVYADTLLLSTRAWRQKGIDSVAALINSNVSGTTNYVAKFTGSNTIGNSQIIDNGTAVGIGTAASNAYKLSVAGIYRGVGVGDAARIELFDTQAGGATFFVNPQQSLGVTSLGTYGAYPISFVTNNSERMRLDASGNLGLGTSSPQAKLDIQGNVIMNGQMTIQSSGVVRGYFGDVDGDNNIQLRSQAALTFKTGGNNLRATLDASGNLGLGVSPSAWGGGFKAMQIGVGSSIYDNGNANGTFIGSNFYFNGTSNLYINTGTATAYAQSGGTHAWYNAPSGTAGNAISFTQAMTLASTGNLLVGGTSDNGSRLNVTGKYYASASLADNIIEVINSDATNGYGLYIRAGGTASNRYVARFKNGADSDVMWVGTSNVGIGTTSPSEKLDLQGTMNMNGAFGTFLQVQYNGGNRGYLGTANSVIAGGGTGDFGISATSNLVFGTGGSLTERMRITSGGNVLVGGTSDNGSRLQVTGAATFSSSVTAGGIITGQVNGNTFGTASATGRAVIIQAGSANQAIQFKNALGGDGTLYATGDATSMNYAFNTYSTGDALVIKNNGSVGIGTTSPATLLHLQQSSGPTIRLVRTSNRFDITGDNDFMELNARDASTYMTFKTADTERMRITSGGELLINTTSDAGDFKLQVNGNGYFTGSVTTNGNFNLPASGVLTAQSSGATIYIHAGATYPGGTIESVGGTAGTNAGNLIFRTGTGTGLQTEALKLDASQNAIFAGSIKTAAPSGGTAKPFKIGAAATVSPTSPNRTIEIEIDGVTYYLSAKTTNN